jgi:plasmid stabilization system protein ParE
VTPELIIRPEAETEIGEAFYWYEEKVSGLGSDFILNLDAAIHAILRNPLLYPTLHKNIRRVLLRRFPYQVFFSYEENRVVVLAVFHGKRDPKIWRHRST